jgi:hypothetical protein
LGRLSAIPDRRRKPAHGRNTDRDLDPLGQDQDQQFLGPGRSPVAELPRRLLDKPEQFALVDRGDFALAVVLTPLGESWQTFGDEPLSDAVYAGLCAEAALSWDRAPNQGQFRALGEEGLRADGSVSFRSYSCKAV